MSNGLNVHDNAYLLPDVRQVTQKAVQYEVRTMVRDCSMDVFVPQIHNSPPISHLCSPLEPHPFGTRFTKCSRRVYRFTEPSCHRTHLPVFGNGRGWVRHTGPHWGSLTWKNTRWMSRSQLDGLAHTMPHIDVDLLEVEP